jgi:hypothetical protein
VREVAVMMPVLVARRRAILRRLVYMTWAPVGRWCLVFLLTSQSRRWPN